MQNITEQDVINYAQERHHIPAAYAKNWYKFWTGRNWITTTGKAILNWQTKFDWWVLDHKDKLILSQAPAASPTPTDIYARQLQRQREERERNERQYEAELNDPAAQAQIAAIQQRLLGRA